MASILLVLGQLAIVVAPALERFINPAGFARFAPMTVITGRLGQTRERALVKLTG